MVRQLYWDKLSGEGKVAGHKNRVHFDQNLRLLIPARIKFYQICDFNFPQKLGFTKFATLNSHDF